MQGQFLIASGGRVRFVASYEGIDKVRSEEITRKAGDSLLPALSKLPGLRRLLLDRCRRGRLHLDRLFEDARQAHESARMAARSVREQKLESALPNTPKITAGPVIVHESRGAVATNSVPALA